MPNEVVKGKPGEVWYRVPSFQNFGKRMDELELEHCRQMMNHPGLPSRIATALESFSTVLDSFACKAEDALNEQRTKEPQLANVLKSELRNLHNEIGKSLDDAQRELVAIERQPKGNDFEIPAAPPKDLQLLEIALDDGQKWTAEVQRRIDGYLAEWPNLRPRVLQAVFDAYREAYNYIWEFAGGEVYDRITLPVPNSPAVVEDLFQISAIYIRKNMEVFALTGRCTWDDEHGLGIRIENGTITKVGHLDIVYCD